MKIVEILLLLIVLLPGCRKADSKHPVQEDISGQIEIGPFNPVLKKAMVDFIRLNNELSDFNSSKELTECPAMFFL